MAYHLAQINVGRARGPADSPEMADFYANLDRINRLAEESPGFVWRLQSDSGNATDIILTEDPLFIINMSVWESVESLKAYVLQSEHRLFLKRRKEWFQKYEGAYAALWWVPAGYFPTPEEGLARLAELERKGPGQGAFNFATLFDAPAL